MVSRAARSRDGAGGRRNTGAQRLGPTRCMEAADLDLTFRRARRDDLRAPVALLADDALDSGRKAAAPV